MTEIEEAYQEYIADLEQRVDKVEDENERLRDDLRRDSDAIDNLRVENERLKEHQETRIWGSRLASAEKRARDWERRDKHVRDLQSRLSAAEDGAKEAARHHAFVLTQITGQLKRAEEVVGAAENWRWAKENGDRRNVEEAELEIHKSLSGIRRRNDE